PQPLHPGVGRRPGDVHVARDLVDRHPPVSQQQPDDRPVDCIQRGLRTSAQCRRNVRRVRHMYILQSLAAQIVYLSARLFSDPSGRRTLLVVRTSVAADFALPADHPGFSDVSYRERRAAIAAVGDAYTPGDPIPDVGYTAAEDAVWRVVSGELD